MNIQAADEDMETEELIAKVAEGEYDLTVADSHILDIELTWRDDVRATSHWGIHNHWGGPCAHRTHNY